LNSFSNPMGFSSAFASRGCGLPAVFDHRARTTNRGGICAPPFKPRGGPFARAASLERTLCRKEISPS